MEGIINRAEIEIKAKTKNKDASFEILMKHKYNRIYLAWKSKKLPKQSL
jgi:hypothetical protein